MLVIPVLSFKATINSKGEILFREIIKIVFHHSKLILRFIIVERKN